jgi:hypothetical protein
VLEDEEAAWVDGGVMTIAFIDYLAHFVTEKAPSGWTIVGPLPFPFVPPESPENKQGVEHD